MVRTEITGILVTAAGNGKWHSHLENSLAVPYKHIKHVLITQPTFLGIYPKEVKT